MEMLFPIEIGFNPNEPQAALAQLPAAPAVFSLRGQAGEPYLNRTENLRARVKRLLTPAATQSRRLQLAALVRHIAWAETGSDFDAQLRLYVACVAIYGERAAQRLHLRPACFLRMGMQNRYPRLYTTTSLSARSSADLFGPFASRPAAERYAEQLLDLHLLRRCFQDLDPDPDFPGCIYSEMKKCLAPCYGGCSDARYSEEAGAVHAFLRTRGQSTLATLAAERERASDTLDFEAAAQAHTRYTRAEAVASLAPELAGSLAEQQGVLVQPSTTPDAVSLYLLARGSFAGPVAFSTLGMRLPNESSGSSSLFAHPAAFTAVPLGPSDTQEAIRTPDSRLEEAIAALDAARSKATSKQELCDHQALLARWYYRSEKKREGELVLADRTGIVPRKPLLRSIARVFRAHVERHAPHVEAQA